MKTIMMESTLIYLQQNNMTDRINETYGRLTEAKQTESGVKYLVLKD